MRTFIAKEKVGTPSACTTRPTAYCVGTTYNNNWHRDCAPTPEGCEEAREVILKRPPTGYFKVGTCRLARNINPLDALDAITAAGDL